MEGGKEGVRHHDSDFGDVEPKLLEPHAPLPPEAFDEFIRDARNATRSDRERNLAQTRDEERRDGQGFGYREKFGE